jgi:hypothetical protein
MRATAAPTLLALGLVACGSGSEDPSAGALHRFPVPGCEAFDHAPCDVREEACQAQLFDLALCLRGGGSGAPPAVSLMTEPEYAEYLNGLVEPPPQPNHYERALVMLRLVAAAAFEPATVVAERVTNVLGVYRHATEDVVIIDHGAATDDETASRVLIHEFIHALQDRDVDLEARDEEYASSYDSYLAVRALSEGEARLHEIRYLASLSGVDPGAVDWRVRFQRSLEYSEGWVFEQTSPYSAAYDVFPYQWGARYLNFAWEAGGFDAVLARFASPPLTTHTLMTSIDAAAEPVTPSAPATLTPPEGWSPFADATLGAWGTFLLLGQTAPRETARATAFGWRGDRLFVFAGPASADGAEPATAVVWVMDFADEATAAAAHTSAVVNGAVWITERVGARLTVATCDQVVDLAWAFVP